MVSTLVIIILIVMFQFLIPQNNIDTEIQKSNVNEQVVKNDEPSDRQKRLFEYRDPTSSNEESHLYDLSFSRCDSDPSAEVKILYFDKIRRQVFVSFDCLHGVTGNTSDALFAIDLNKKKSKFISAEYVSYPLETNSSISPNNKYLILSNRGHSGGCGLYGYLGLLNLDDLNIKPLDATSGEYRDLLGDNLIEISFVDKLLDSGDGQVWDENGNLLFIREIVGCFKPELGIEGGYNILFTEKWSYDPTMGVYKLIDKVKNSDRI